MFVQNRQHDLTLLYKVLSKDDNTLNPVINAMSDYIINRGNAIVQDQQMLESFDLFVKALLELKRQMDGLIETSFRNHVRF